MTSFTLAYSQGISSSILCGRDSDSDRDEAEASDDDMMDEVDDRGRHFGSASSGSSKPGSKRGSRVASPEPTPAQKKDGEFTLRHVEITEFSSHCKL